MRKKRKTRIGNEGTAYPSTPSKLNGGPDETDLDVCGVGPPSFDPHGLRPKEEKG
jgi:hypothetical protein